MMLTMTGGEPFVKKSINCHQGAFWNWLIIGFRPAIWLRGGLSPVSVNARLRKNVYWHQFLTACISPAPVIK
jgi:hypothetical protein